MLQPPNISLPVCSQQKRNIQPTNMYEVGSRGHFSSVEVSERTAAIYKKQKYQPALLHVAWSFMAGGARAAARFSNLYRSGAKRLVGSSQRDAAPTLNSRYFAHSAFYTQETRGMFHLVQLISWFNMGAEGITEQVCALYRTLSLIWDPVPL